MLWNLVLVTHIATVVKILILQEVSIFAPGSVMFVIFEISSVFVTSSCIHMPLSEHTTYLHTNPVVWCGAVRRSLEDNKTNRVIGVIDPVSGHPGN